MPAVAMPPYRAAAYTTKRPARDVPALQGCGTQPVFGSKPLGFATLRRGFPFCLHAPYKQAGRSRWQGPAAVVIGGGSRVIRGAIEVAQDKLVSGWIYSSVVGLRDTLVLAFSGARCVGSGRVEIFRQDLFDAQTRRRLLRVSFSGRSRTRRAPCLHRRAAGRLRRRPHPVCKPRRARLGLTGPLHCTQRFDSVR